MSRSPKLNFLSTLFLSTKRQTAERGNQHWLLLYSPILLAILLMMPRLLSAQFGLFDDGLTLRVAHEMATGEWQMWDTLVGRFRPTYWLFWSLPFFLGGQNPLWFFLANTVVLVGTTATLISLVRLAGGSLFQAWFTGMLFTLSGPVIENFYTLSKGEPIQVLLLLLSLILVAGTNNVKGLSGRCAALIVASLLILLASASKETSLIMFPVSLAWLVGGRLLRRSGNELVRNNVLKRYLFAIIIGVTAFLLWRGSVVGFSMTGVGYATNYDLSINSILSSGFRWLGWLIRDFSYLFLFCMVLLVLIYSNKELLKQALLYDALVWMAGWLLIFLPWTYTVGYFLLPFTIGASIFCGVIADHTLRHFSRFRTNIRVVISFFLAAVLILLLITIANNITDARIQLAVDKANAEVLDYLAANLPPHSMVLVNIQDPNEYFDEVGIHLTEVRGRFDLTVEPFQNQSLELEAANHNIYLLSPFIENQLLLSVRMGVYEPTMKKWNESLQDSLRDVDVLVYHNEYHFRLLNIDTPRVFCQFFSSRGYCSTPSPLINRRLFSYGWKVYLIGNP